MRFFKLFIKKKKPNQRRTLIAGNMSKCGWVDGPREGSSWSQRAIMDSVVSYFVNFFPSLFITLDGRCDGSSQAQRSVESLYSITLKLFEFGFWDYFFDIHDEQAGRTVMDKMFRHARRKTTLGQNSPSSFSSFTTMQPTDRHRHNGPSQAPYVVLFCIYCLKTFALIFRQISYK